MHKCKNKEADKLIPSQDYTKNKNLIEISSLHEIKRTTCGCGWIYCERGPHPNVKLDKSGPKVMFSGAFP